MEQLNGKATDGRLSVEDAYTLEDAIDFMWRHLKDSSPHPKPVKVHCLRMALALEADGTDLEVVIAALFHDLLEDTDITADILSSSYSPEIASIVAATSYHLCYADHRRRDLDMYERCVQEGWKACLVKVADLYDNSLYFFPEQPEKARWFRDKATILVEMTEGLIGDRPAWKRLKLRAEELAP